MCKPGSTLTLGPGVPTTLRTSPPFLPRTLPMPTTPGTRANVDENCASNTPTQKGKPVAKRGRKARGREGDERQPSYTGRSRSDDLSGARRCDRDPLEAP